MRTLVVAMLMLVATIASEAKRPSYLEEKPFQWWQSEKEYYEADTAVIYQMFEILNNLRASYGRHPLILDHQLLEMANVRSYEVSIHADWRHRRPDGSDFYTIYDQYGYGHDSGGENFCVGAPTPAEAMSAFMASYGHKWNMLGWEYTRVGIGYWPEKHCWVQLFADNQE